MIPLFAHVCLKGAIRSRDTGVDCSTMHWKHAHDATGLHQAKLTKPGATVCSRVSSSMNSVADFTGGVTRVGRLSSPDTLAPHRLVETSVDADIGGSHLLHGELADLLDGAGGPLLETPTRRRGLQFPQLVHRVVQPLGRVQRATSKHVHEGADICTRHPSIMSDISISTLFENETSLSAALLRTYSDTRTHVWPKLRLKLVLLPFSLYGRWQLSDGIIQWRWEMIEPTRPGRKELNKTPQKGPSTVTGLPHSFS